MVKIPQNPILSHDRTLEAADLIYEAAKNDQKARDYLGMSSIGDPCARKLWLRLNGKKEYFSAKTLKRFEDGHRTEELIINRLKMMKDLEVFDVDENGEQFGFSDFGGKFKGHMDGVIKGLIEAPKTPHVLEIKCSEKMADLIKIKNKYGEKSALKKWSETYYAQAVLYMYYAGLDRHYLICATPGGRDWCSIRTESDKNFALAMIEKAKRIISAKTAPEKIGGPDWWQCRLCSFHSLCHGV